MTGQQVEGLACLVVLSIVVGLVAAEIEEKGWLEITFRRLGLTKKHSQLDVWYDVFKEFRGEWCRVCFKDNTAVTGWTRFFSDDPNAQGLFLADALVEEADGSTRLVDGPGVLIPGGGEILRIELVNAGDGKVTEENKVQKVPIADKLIKSQAGQQPKSKRPDPPVKKPKG